MPKEGITPCVQLEAVCGCGDQMQGTLFKWTNYISGWQPRWFVLDSGILSYYLSPEEVKSGSRGAFKVSSCNIRSHATDNRRIDCVSKSGVCLYVRASTPEDRQQWMVALGEAKQKEPMTPLTPKVEQDGVEEFVKSKMTDLHRTCQLLVQHVGVIKGACTNSHPLPQVQVLEETTKELQETCDHFLSTLADCMELEEHLRERVSLSSRQSSVTGEEGLGQYRQRYVQSVPKDLFFPSGSGGHSPTTPLATPPSPSLRGFSEKELYATSYSLPSPTHAHSSFPSRHDHSRVPSHLVAHSTHSHLARHTSSHQEKKVHTSLPIQVQHTSPSVEIGARQVEEGKEEEEEEEEEEEARESRSMEGLLGMSRTGSEAFITPDSSPRNSHVGTPTGKSPPPIAASEAEDPPQAPTRVYETMFSKRPHKFDDFELDSDGHIPTEPFLLACIAILPFFDAISPVTLAPVKLGVNGDITTLYNIQKSSPSQFPTLQSMVLHELRTKTNQTPPPATNAVQWVKRVLEFIHAFMNQIALGEEDLCVAAGKAYTETLRKYHNWVVRGIFQVGIKTLPYRRDLMITFGAVEKEWEESHRVVIEDLEAAIRPMYELLCNLNQFLTEHNLEL